MTQFSLGSVFYVHLNGYRVPDGAVSRGDDPATSGSWIATGGAVQMTNEMRLGADREHGKIEAVDEDFMKSE